MTYSVPDRSVRRQSALPNPIEKRSTRTPQRRATQKRELVSDPQDQTPADEQPTDTFTAVESGEADGTPDRELHTPGEPTDSSGGDIVAQIERLVNGAIHIHQEVRA